MTLSPRLVISATITAIVVSVLGGGLGVLMYLRVVVGMDVSQQRILMRLPASFRALVDIKDPVPIQINGLVNASVPIDQVFQLPLKSSYVAQVAFNTHIPLKTTVTYRGSIPIRAFADLRGSTALVADSRLLPKFDLMARVPLNFDLPMTLTVPIDTQVALAYRGPLQFSLNQQLAVPVRTIVNAQFHLHREAQAPVLANIGLLVHAPTAAIPVFIEQAGLSLSLHQLSLQRSAP